MRESLLQRSTDGARVHEQEVRLCRGAGCSKSSGGESESSTQGYDRISRMAATNNPMDHRDFPTMFGVCCGRTTLAFRMSHPTDYGLGIIASRLCLVNRTAMHGSLAPARLRDS